MENDRKTIIIVDDDPVMRQALAGVLTSLGHRVQSFASASAFFAVAAKTEAACLILDIQLGSESGIELAKQLAASRFNFPIIFMSGSDDERLRRNALDAGAVTFLSKPSYRRFDVGTLQGHCCTISLDSARSTFASLPFWHATLGRH